MPSRYASNIKHSKILVHVSLSATRVLPWLRNERYDNSLLVFVGQTAHPTPTPTSTPIPNPRSSLLVFVGQTPYPTPIPNPRSSIQSDSYVAAIKGTSCTMEAILPSLMNIFIALYDKSICMCPFSFLHFRAIWSFENYFLLRYYSLIVQLET